MNVLLISQCSKNALTATRRVLDQFAERKGERTWQTLITQDGLDTLRKMLRQNARRNTAVACWWQKQGAPAELLWIVGNRAEFNQAGSVPTNRTRRDILRASDENQWHTLEAIGALAALAGLFHDFGKANQLFQKKLQAAARTREPVRHEWVSLILFVAFVNDRPDREWLAALAQVTPADEPQVLARLAALGPQPGSKTSRDLRLLNPFAYSLKTPLARAVGWLIVSHHRLLHANPDGNNAPQIAVAAKWLVQNSMDATWNSPPSDLHSAAEHAAVWTFPHGTPLLSHTWRSRARSMAARAQQHEKLFGPDWLADSFSAHLARLALMLADHSYSSHPALPARQDPAYRAWANTANGKPNQRLDEHNLGVGRLARYVASWLPTLRSALPALTRHPGFKKRATDARFHWQDKAFDLAASVAGQARSQGFFGINMASTGCGKTFANARILYALADQKQGCRFGVALGLRTLTLQTGDALRQRLQLKQDDLAVLIGSAAVRQLHEMGAGASGSESADALLDPTSYVHYAGELDQGPLRKILGHNPALPRLLGAPILVSTIDYLTPATEGARGGRQIGPMLRLLTGDLILDEPDDFDLADLPALTRLVHWAGMLGTRIVLSSATLPPALVEALFAAYAAGRALFHAARGDSASVPPVVCAWFDEFARHSATCANQAELAQQHRAFVAARVTNLVQKSPILRRGAWLPLVPPAAGANLGQAAVATLAQAMRAGALRLHAAHGYDTPDGQHRVSFGLLRFANIRQLVAVAQAMLTSPWPSDTEVRFCIYHSRHPLVVRSAMEQMLDQALTRHDPNSVWQVPAVRSALAGARGRDVIFMVFATAVAEVGRDHDYDWSVVEPSSLRSIIQLAGRVQRHRQQVPDSPNLLLLSHNYHALCRQELAYCKPGFEDKTEKLTKKDLQTSLPATWLDSISAQPRIQEPANLMPKQNLADLEHQQLRNRLFGKGQGATPDWYAALWWQAPVQWCGELQRQTRFRQGRYQQEFVFYLKDETDELTLHRLNDDKPPTRYDEGLLQREEVHPAAGVQPWLELDLRTLLVDLAERLEISLEQASRRFGGIELNPAENYYRYEPQFGVYQPVP